MEKRKERKPERLEGKVSKNLPPINNKEGSGKKREKRRGHEEGLGDGK